jgi:hypothetical protein
MSVGTQQNAPPPLTAGAAAPLPTVREQGPWYRSRPDSSWILKGFFILLLIGLAILFLYPFEWLAAAAFKPRGETFDNAFLPQHWAWNYSGAAIPSPAPSEGNISDGQQLFTLRCAGCHQIEGRGGFVTGARVQSGGEATVVPLKKV